MVLLNHFNATHTPNRFNIDVTHFAAVLQQHSLVFIHQNFVFENSHKIRLFWIWKQVKAYVIHLKLGIQTETHSSVCVHGFVSIGYSKAYISMAYYLKKLF